MQAISPRSLIKLASVTATLLKIYGFRVVSGVGNDSRFSARLHDSSLKWSLPGAQWPQSTYLNFRKSHKLAAIFV